MSQRRYSGDPIDCTYTYITERPELEAAIDAEDVVYATEAEEQGTETSTNVPIPRDGEDDEPVRIPGQSTLSEFEGGSGE